MRPVYVEANRWEGTPTVYGQSDCMLMVAEWVERCTGRDYAASIRGLYHSLEGAERVAGWKSDPVGAVERLVNGELERVAPEDVQIGDVAVLIVPQNGLRVPAGAVRLDGSWLCKAPEHGATEIDRPLNVLAVWRVPQGDAE